MSEREVPLLPMDSFLYSSPFDFTHTHAYRPGAMNRL